MLDITSILRQFDMPAVFTPAVKARLNPNSVTWLACSAMEQWLKHPVIFQTTPELEEEMAHVDVTIRPTEYQQSYPAIVIQHRNFTYSIVADVVALGVRVLFVGHSKYVPDAIGGQYSFTVGLNEFSPSKTIEDAILKVQADLPPTQVEMREINRVAINTALLLASHPTRLTRTERQRELRRIAKSNDRARAVSAREKLKLQPQFICFDRQPVLYDRAGDGEGSPVRAHWRRGHFRSQPCGPRRSERRIVFVRRTLVHADNVIDRKNEVVFKVT